MATFEAQVEGLTGLSIDSSSSPTQTELSTFINDGVLDVTSKLVAMDPGNAEDFARESSEQTSNGFNPGTNKILSVIRESGTDGQWYPCVKKHISLQYKVTDVESLEYASQYNPVFMITENRNVNVYPTPGSSNDGFKVLYVNTAPVNGSDGALVFSNDTINYFPNDKIYLVILYASIKSLGSNLSSFSLGTMNLPAPPVAPVLTDHSYSLPTASLDGTSSAVPTYNPPSVSPDFADADNWVNTEEDDEMLSARMSVITGQLSKYGNDMSNELNKFNKLVTEYQSNLQKEIENTRFSENDDNRALQKFQSELTIYGTDVNKEVQRWTNEELTSKRTDYEWKTSRKRELQQQYDAAFGLMQRPQPQQQGGR